MTEVRGRAIGSYQIVDFLAKGESATVYKGYQPGMNRSVAIKMLPPSAARDAEASLRFQRQAELMARLEHKYILPVYDSGLENGLPYLVARFAERGALNKHVASYKDLQRTAQLLNQICEALDYTHQQGLVHGNIKPANILLDAQNQPLITDFGPGQLGLSGSVYMSSEQAQGGPIDQRTDVYALGALIYELLTGQPPPMAATPEPRLHRPDLPTAVVDVILKAMSQDPEERYATAGELSFAFEQAIRPTDEKPEPGQAIDIAEEPQEELIYTLPPPEPEADYRWMFIAGAILVVMVLICGGLAVMINWLFDGDQGEAEIIGIPYLTADVDQNVWSGPGPNYAVYGLLTSGQKAQILGASPDGAWWQILYPRAEAGLGWVAVDLVTAEYAQNVPVVNPPPVPISQAWIRDLLELSTNDRLKLSDLI